MNRGFFKRVLQISRALYLFTVDDLVSIVIPNTVCGSLLPLAGKLVREPVVTRDIIARVPLVLSWVWCNLLFFNISNQSQPGAILEDNLNKPWRPIASGLVRLQSVKYYIHAVRLALFFLSLALRTTLPTVCIQLLTLWYNEFQGGEGWISRNMLNAGGYLCFMVGSMQIAMGSEVGFSNVGLRWLGWTWIVISSTMHIQDLYDQAGDRARDRRTIPLVFGDMNARYSLALFVILWSFVAPTLWGVSIAGGLPSAVMGLIISIRLLTKGNRNVSYDKRTFVYWIAWLISINVLPLWA